MLPHLEVQVDAAVVAESGQSGVARGVAQLLPQFLVGLREGDLQTDQVEERSDARFRGPGAQPGNMHRSVCSLHKRISTENAEGLADNLT